MIAINAHAIATTGRDIGGEFLPLYTQTDKQSWYQPLVIYVRVLTFMVLPLNEWSMRVPTVLLALTNIALMFLLILRLYGNVPLAAVAGAMLGLTLGISFTAATASTTSTRSPSSLAGYCVSPRIANRGANITSGWPRVCSASAFTATSHQSS